MSKLKATESIDDVRTYPSYDEMAKDALTCTRCDLCLTRKHVVLGGGPLSARVMIIGEAPGATEDETGIPFVGRAGKLLIRLFNEIGVERDQIYITNILKCRPPENRNPAKEEIKRCIAFLDSQIHFINPEVIVPVGNFASRYILETKEGITKIRGKTFSKNNRLIVPCVHPAYVLRNGKRAEQEMLTDLFSVKNILDEK